MADQIVFFDDLFTQEELDELERQAEAFNEYQKKKRNWENAFQKWSNDSFMNDDYTSYGACGYGSMCEWCEANDYGRPCVRALNAMCRENGIRIDYSERNFEKIWNEGRS